MYHQDHAGVLISPPALWGACFAIGFVLDNWYPLAIGAPLGLRGIGIVIAIAAGVMLSWAGAAFKEHEEDVDVSTPTRHFISTGPYFYSRNPMYFAATVVFVGIAILFNSWWLLVASVVQFAILHYGVVKREERYLQTRFGKSYHDYKKRVPRWI